MHLRSEKLKQASSQFLYVCQLTLANNFCSLFTGNLVNRKEILFCLVFCDFALTCAALPLLETARSTALNILVAFKIMLISFKYLHSSTLKYKKIVPTNVSYFGRQETGKFALWTLVKEIVKLNMIEKTSTNFTTVKVNCIWIQFLNLQNFSH